MAQLSTLCSQFFNVATESRSMGKNPSILIHIFTLAPISGVLLPIDNNYIEEPPSPNRRVPSPTIRQSRFIENALRNHICSFDANLRNREVVDHAFPDFYKIYLAGRPLEDPRLPPGFNLHSVGLVEEFDEGESAGCDSSGLVNGFDCEAFSTVSSNLERCGVCNFEVGW